MKTKRQLTALIAMVTCLFPLMGHALTAVNFDFAAVSQWAANEDTITVPAGSAYELDLGDGDTAVLDENTQFKVVDEEDEPLRIILLNGTLVLNRTGPGNPIDITSGTNTISVGSGATMVVESSGGVTSVAQFGTSGTVSVNGDPIPSGAGGTITDSSFSASQSVSSTLTAQATQLIRMVTPGPRPPYEKMKALPRKIVEENLNDLSPS